VLIFTFLLCYITLNVFTVDSCPDSALSGDVFIKVVFPWRALFIGSYQLSSCELRKVAMLIALKSFIFLLIATNVAVRGLVNKGKSVIQPWTFSLIISLNKTCVEVCLLYRNVCFVFFHLAAFIAAYILRFKHELICFGLSDQSVIVS